MVVIRLSRGGAKKRPFYHVVATDSRHARDSGKYIERLGYYNPMAKGGETPLHLELDRVNHWINQGAQTSDRVDTLIKLAGQTPEQLTAIVAKKEQRKQRRAENAAKAEAEKADEAA